MAHRTVEPLNITDFTALFANRLMSLSREYQAVGTPKIRVSHRTLTADTRQRSLKRSGLSLRAIATLARHSPEANVRKELTGLIDQLLHQNILVAMD